MQTEKRFVDVKSGTASPPKKAKVGAANDSPMEVVEGGTNAFLMRLTHIDAANIHVNPARSYSKSGVLHCFKTDKLSFITKRLDEHKILSMPVCTHQNIFTGFVDCADIVRYVANHFSNANPTTWVDFQRLWDNIDGFSSTTVEQLLQMENRHSSPRYPIPAGYSLFHAFELLARSGYERVCITNAEGQIASIISQSMLIDYMHENVAQLGSVLRNRRIADFVGLHPGLPCRVKMTDKVVTGFQKMSRWNVSGLGVVDLNGKLVDVLTERDLRGNKLDAISFWGLYSTVASFKESVRQTYGEVPNRLITVKQTDTLEKALYDMSTNKIRQLFVVDANNVPVKMISQKDLLFQVLNQPIEG